MSKAEPESLEGSGKSNEEAATLILSVNKVSVRGKKSLKVDFHNSVKISLENLRSVSTS